MPNPFDKLSAKERHYKSLEASAELAEKASLIALEKDWSYEKSANYVRKMDSRLAELEKHGYISEQPSRNYSMSSYEAANTLAGMAKSLMREEKISYAEAVNRILSDPQNAEIARCYSEND